MKLVRYGEAGKERPGLIDKQGKVRDLGYLVPDFTGQWLAPAVLSNLAGLDVERHPLVEGNPRLGPCVPRPSNFVAVGLNYTDHAKETGSAVPDEPVLFNKAPNCIVGANDDVVLPRDHKKVDWELELAIVIGKRAEYVSEEDAYAHIAGFCICHDVSERSFQLERGGQWTKGKSAATFGPLGPWMVTTDEIGDVQKLEMWLDVNGERKQSGTTANMIFSAATLVSYISRFMALEPGDVITTGTPAGVGLGMKPQQFLKAGDVVTMGIEGLGEQRQVVRAWQASEVGQN